MKISVVGMGNVGAATAHALVSAGLAQDLVLVSRNARRAEGEAMDLDQAGAVLPHVTHVRGGAPELTQGSDLVILAHSVPTERPGRKLLAEGNAAAVPRDRPTLRRAEPRRGLPGPHQPGRCDQLADDRTDGPPGFPGDRRRDVD